MKAWLWIFLPILLCPYTQASIAAPQPSAAQVAEYNQAIRLVDKGDLAQARKLLLDLCRTPYGQTDAMLYSRLADTYLSGDNSLRNPRQAEICLQKSLQIDPEFGIAYRNLAGLANQRERWPECLQWATKALTCKEPDKTALYHRSRAYFALGKPNEALADMNAFLQIARRKSADYYDYKAQLQLKLGKIDDAIATYREEMPLRKDWAVFQIVHCLEMEKKTNQAIKELSTYITTNQIDDEAYRLRGQLFVKTKDLKAALADYTKAIAIEPLSLYYRERSKIYAALGQSDLAKKDLDEAEKRM